MNLVSRSRYYRLLQLRVVSRSLSHDALVVLVHAFVTSRIGHGILLIDSRWPHLGVLGRLDRVLCSLLGSLCEFPNSALSLPTCAMCCTVLLPVAQRISYRIPALVSRCTLDCALSYLQRWSLPPSGRRCSRPSIWNDLPSELRLLPLTNLTGF